jgi:hypothetical protein
MTSDFACLNATSLREHPTVPGAVPVPNGRREPCRSWNVLRHLASHERAEFQVGLAFVQRTFLLCVCCFGVTCVMTTALLVFEAATVGPGGNRVLYDDVCSRRTNWSCTQWFVDVVLAGVVIPIKFWRGWRSSYTLPMLVLLDVSQSANLALIGCASPALSPLCFHTYICFEAALVTVWLCTVRAASRASACHGRYSANADVRPLEDNPMAASERQPLSPEVRIASHASPVGFQPQWAGLVGAGGISCAISSCVLVIFKTRFGWLPVASEPSDGAHVAPLAKLRQ